MELAAGVRHATHLGHTELEASLVAAEVIAHELASPALLTRQAEEGSCVLAASAVSEVEDDGLDGVELCGAVAPQVSALFEQWSSAEATR
jgi:hypothetical protein